MASNRKTDKAKPARPQNPRPTIGLFVGQIEERYQTLVWPGVADMAEERDANLICFVGRALESPHWFDVQRNVLYDLAGPENLDGLVIMSGTLGRHIGVAALRDFCLRYHPLPMTSIALAIEGIPSVLMDNENGIREAVTHLIEVHGYRRIAFIGGPEGQQEADQRYRTYVDVLAEHDIPLDPGFIIPGDFRMETGKRATHRLLDQRQVAFEALVAANDNMAIGALEALHAHGIRVPDDVSVVGFDDTEESRYTAPPLTTVRQPLYEQGRRAAELLLAQIAGDEVPMRITLPTQLITRHSCGCLPHAVRQAAAGGITINATTFAARRDHMLADMIGAVEVPDNLEPRWSEQLLDTFVADLQDASSSAFLKTLAELLGQVIAGSGDVIQWQGLLSALRRGMLPCIPNDRTLSRAEDLWQQARVLVGEAAQRSQVYWGQRAEERSWILGEVNEALMTSFDVAQLTDTIARELPRLGIRRCYLSLYEQDDICKTIPTEHSRLILAYDEDGRIGLEEGGRRFLSRQLVPRDVLPTEKRYALIVEALHFRDERQFGFILFELLRENRPAYDLLGRQISTALNGALLSQERRRAEEALRKHSEMLEETVETRTRELREAQEELVRKEKLAILGQLAGGVGHELRNPLGVISNAVYFLQMTLADADETTREYLGILFSEVHNAEKIVSDLLDFSRTWLAEKEEVSVSELVTQALKRRPPPENVTVTTVIGGDVPPVFVDPRQVVQVLINLVINAYQAMGSSGAVEASAGGNLTIDAQAERDKVALSITDTGCGIPQENLEKIFEPLFTTKTRGIGLGLAISRNLVRANGGSLEVQSEVGKGSTFTVILPTQERAAS